MICRNIATSASTQLTARVSTDNGVSYYAASGDYKTLTAGTGVENNSGGLSITFTASTAARSEEHTSELQSLMRISYAVFCLKKKNILHTQNHNYTCTNQISKTS